MAPTHGPEPTVPWAYSTLVQYPRYCRLVTHGTNFESHCNKENGVAHWYKMTIELVRNSNKTVLWLLENADTSKDICKMGPLWKVVQNCWNVSLGHSLKRSLFPELDLETKAILMWFLIKGEVQQTTWNYQRPQTLLFWSYALYWKGGKNFKVGRFHGEGRVIPSRSNFSNTACSNKQN